MERVIKGGSWFFDEHLLLTKVLAADEDLMEVELRFTNLWIQVFELPVGLQSERVLSDMENFIGTFVESDPKNLDGNWRGVYENSCLIDLCNRMGRILELFSHFFY